MEQMDIKLIERYFEGDLDEKELALVAQKLEVDPSFADAFQMEKDIVAGIEAAGNQHLRGRLDLIHQEMGNPNTAIERPLRSRRTWVWLAAAAFIGAVVLGKLLWDGRAKTAEELYAMYAVHDFDFTEKGAAEEELREAEALLKAHKYAEALPVLDAYLSKHPTESQVLLVKGIALMEKRDFGQAQAVFDSISANPILASDANWYMALVSLKADRLEESISYLKMIPSSSLRYQKAQELVAELGKIKL